jgi:hypothetical protein
LFRRLFGPAFWVLGFQYSVFSFWFLVFRAQFFGGEFSVREFSVGNLGFVLLDADR